MTEAQDRVPSFPRSPVPGYKSGFVVLAGRPNVGKSALVNRLIGRKVAITSPVPQTTRGRLSATLTLPSAQIVFVDTPGLHKPRHRLGAWLVDIASRALADADVALFVLDAASGVTPDDELVAAKLRGARAPVVVALNRVDRAAPGAIAEAEAAVGGLGTFAAVVPVSAVTGTHVDRLLDVLIGMLPEGPQYFPPEMFTDQPEQFLVRELIREQAIALTREEVPHSIAVEIEEFTPREGKDLLYIRAVLHVERDSHKKMLIGREGRMLKAIGERARREIEGVVASRVYLDLWVKTTERWRDRDNLIKAFYPES